MKTRHFSPTLRFRKNSITWNRHVTMHYNSIILSQLTRIFFWLSSMNSILCSTKLHAYKQPRRVWWRMIHCSFSLLPSNPDSQQWLEKVAASNIDLPDASPQGAKWHCMGRTQTCIIHTHTHTHTQSHISLSHTHTRAHTVVTHTLLEYNMQLVQLLSSYYTNLLSLLSDALQVWYSTE